MELNFFAMSILLVHILFNEVFKLVIENKDSARFHLIETLLHSFNQTQYTGNYLLRRDHQTNTTLQFEHFLHICGQFANSLRRRRGVIGCRCGIEDTVKLFDKCFSLMIFIFLLLVYYLNDELYVSRKIFVPFFDFFDFRI